MRGSILPALTMIAAIGLTSLPPAAAGAPALRPIHYQGYLTDTAGAPVDANVVIEFYLYTVETGGSPLWSEQQPVTVSQGLFSVELGATSGNPFPVGLFDTPVHLALAVDGDGEMTPRRPLTAAAFAYLSEEAELLNGKTAADLDQSAHVVNMANPHGVTAAQAGAPTTGQFNNHAANAAAHHARYTNTEALAAVLAADGPGSGLDADMLDGTDGFWFTSNLNAISSVVSTMLNDVTTLQGQIVPNTGGNFSGNLTVAGGSLGVGTTTPAAPLHLLNPVSGSEALRIQGNNTWLSFWDGSLYDGYLWDNGGNITLGTSHVNSGGSLSLYTYGNERMRIQPTGRIGVGTTLPSYKLHVEDGGVAIYGRSTSNFGLYGYSSGQIGVYGYSNALSSAGVFGQSPYIGVEGITNAGSTNASRQGVRGDNGGSASGWAGYFWGHVGVSGTLSKGAGAFKIDHPLDPANKYLYHSFVESPDMKNIYDGVVTTDSKGYANVTLPDWFEALNGDFRYQLTVIGQFAQAIVSQKMADNQFQIATSEPGVEVSWQVTGIRKDAYAMQNRIPVEEDKPADKSGRYLHPDAFGKARDQAEDYRPGRGLPPAEAL